MTIAYKRVIRRGNCLYSSFTVGSCRVQYIPLEVVRPELGKLFVFSSLELAQKHFWGDEIWECEVENPQSTEKIANSGWEPDYPNFWDEFNKGEKYSSLEYQTAPIGTLLVDSVKLLRKMSNV